MEEGRARVPDWLPEPWPSVRRARTRVWAVTMLVRRRLREPATWAALVLGAATGSVLWLVAVANRGVTADGEVDPTYWFALVALAAALGLLVGWRHCIAVALGFTSSQAVIAVWHPGFGPLALLLVLRLLPTSLLFAGAAAGLRGTRAPRRGGR